MNLLCWDEVIEPNRQEGKQRQKGQKLDGYAYKKRQKRGWALYGVHLIHTKLFIQTGERNRLERKYIKGLEK